MSKSSDPPMILLDSDVIRHFINGGQLDKLAAIFPGRFMILDKVKQEICRSTALKPVVEGFIARQNIPVMSFPKDQEIIMEYAYLCREFGVGESACMAVARHQKQFIASSNLKDIGKFCDKHGITYLTTMDILSQGLDDKIMSANECNQFITDVLAKGSKLPFTNIADLRNSKV